MTGFSDECHYHAEKMMPGIIGEEGPPDGPGFKDDLKCKIIILVGTILGTGKIYARKTVRKQ